MRNSIYVNDVIQKLRLRDKTCGLKISKEIGEIHHARVEVLSILMEISMNYFPGNVYI